MASFLPPEFLRSSDRSWRLWEMMFFDIFLSFFSLQITKVFFQKKLHFRQVNEEERWSRLKFVVSPRVTSILMGFWWNERYIYLHESPTKINHSCTGKYTLRLMGIRNGIFSGNKKYYVFHIEPSTLCPRWMWRCSLWPNWDLLHLGLNQACCWGEGEEYGKAAIYDYVATCIHEHQPFMLDKCMPCL